MPMLPLERSIFPDNLLDDYQPEVGELSVRWWALYAKSRQEKALARQLLAYQVPFYLPLVSTKQYVRGRRQSSYLPLFAGYVFAYGTDEQRVAALTTNRISRILPVHEHVELIKDLRQIRDLIARKAPLTLESRLDRGARVRVRRGALMGLEGEIIRRNGKDRLLVAVKYLQQGVSVEIDDCMVEQI